MTTKKGSKQLTAQDILDALDLELHMIEVPEWAGGHVWIKPLTADDQTQLDSFYNDTPETEDTTKNIRCLVVALCVCDEKGKRLFTKADIAALGNKNIAPIRRIFDAAMKNNGMTAGAAEEIKKN